MRTVCVWGGGDRHRWPSRSNFAINRHQIRAQNSIARLVASALALLMGAFVIALLSRVEVAGALPNYLMGVGALLWAAGAALGAAAAFDISTHR